MRGMELGDLLQVVPGFVLGEQTVTDQRAREGDGTPVRSASRARAAEVVLEGLHVQSARSVEHPCERRFETFRFYHWIDDASSMPRLLPSINSLHAFLHSNFAVYLNLNPSSSAFSFF